MDLLRYTSYHTTTIKPAHLDEPVLLESGYESHFRKSFPCIQTMVLSSQFGQVDVFFLIVRACAFHRSRFAGYMDEFFMRTALHDLPPGQYPRISSLKRQEESRWEISDWFYRG